MATNPIVRSLPEAIVTMLAALLTMACALAIDPEPGPAILAVVLCLSLSRSQLDQDLRGRLEAAATLPAVSLAAFGVAMLLHRAPWAGAAVFVAAMSLAIWLRRFGVRARRAGSLIALPFVVILTTPYVPTMRVGHAMALLLPVIVALLAWLWVTTFHSLGRRLGWLAPVPASKDLALDRTPSRASTMRPIASSRMAIQMAIALAASFVVGYVFFAERWAWIVLTAYIVGSGNQGRLDVAYKSVLRILGAGAGTLAAATFTVHAGSHDATTAALILLAVFLGIWLRPLGYAWWALFVTLALALLQGFEGPGVPHLLSLRLEEIVIGAMLGVASAWFVLPVRSTDVLRRRIADALAMLADALDPATPASAAGDFLAALENAEQVAPAFRASRRVTRRWRTVQPANWIDTLTGCGAPAAALIHRGQTPGSVRKAVGAARKAMREPGEIQPALENLRRCLLARTTD